MKQELTLAVILLAIGGLLWIASPDAGFQSQQFNVGSQRVDWDGQSAEQSGVGSASEHQLAEPPKQPTNLSQQLANSPEHYAVVPASFQQSVATDNAPTIAVPNNLNSSPANFPDLNSLSSPRSTPTASPFSLTAGYLHPTSNPLAIKLLADAAYEIANSNPFRLKLGLQGKVFQQEILASGNYYQAGQGSHKTKIDLTFDRMSGQPKLLQLCDGRFIYTIHSNGLGATTETTENAKIKPLRQKLEFVDLLRVKEATGTASAKRGAISPTGWVATGGIASLLQHLASGFNFGPPEPLDPNSNRVLIRGGWDETALRGVVADLDNNLRLGSPIQWDQVPPHLPHVIEMVLTRSSNQGANQVYFPSQISYLRFGMKEKQAIMEPSFSMTFSPPETLSKFPDDFFVIDSSNLEPTDATDRYIARIESFNRMHYSRSQRIATEQSSDSSTK